ncbi:helix-turn-helix domain-containing protein [Pseudochrobactrum sp. XF203]|uniref:helix-turn-helix domain-containing protein n=1 Tax=Pseudochrobactrum sp. XF203 TaxID=2879116 RepID=UPI001CE27E83|nr:helix-turn-helix domain-containing protein [Pseudochrobactrum sp. XF203]UCA47718.1 hypothetical protein LDL70_16855 [Pseudochrobactrum sp. XF203]
MKTEVDFGCRGSSVEDVSIYRGMNPKFVQRVWKKRRSKQREHKTQTHNSTIPDVLISAELLVSLQFETFEELRMMAADLFNVPKETLDEKNRTVRVVRAKHAAICAAKIHWPDISLSALGREFFVDHTSALHALRKYGIYTSQSQTKSAA